MQQGAVAWSCGLSRPPWGIILEQCSESEEDLKNWDVVLFFFLQGEIVCVRCIPPIHPGSFQVQQRPHILETKRRVFVLGSTVCPL